MRGETEYSKMRGEEGGGERERERCVVVKEKQWQGTYEKRLTEKQKRQEKFVVSEPLKQMRKFRIKDQHF